MHQFPEDYISISHWGMFPVISAARQFIPYKPMPGLDCPREMPPKSSLYA